MIRKFLNKKNRNTRSNLCSNRRFGQIEKLEDRNLLAFVGFFDGVTLDLVQTFDDGDVVIDNSGLGGAFRTIDSADTLTFVAAENVTVTMLDGTANQLDFNINTEHAGDVQLNLGAGPRETFFAGASNNIGGNLEVNGSAGPQFVNLTDPIALTPLATGGSATINLGDGFDVVDNNGIAVTIGGDLNLTGVNLFNYTGAGMVVTGSMTMDVSNESVESFLFESGGASIINGDVVYIGGDDVDHVDLNATFVAGDVNIDLGEGLPFFGDPQNFTTTEGGQIDGNISVTAGDSNLGNVVELRGLMNGTSIDITLGDSSLGVNVVDLTGTFNGDDVTLNLSDTVDEVTYSFIVDPLLDPADVVAFMGEGDDIFTLNTGLNQLEIDFGNDLGDEFINNFGQFNFDAEFTNFHWFNHVYIPVNDSLEMTQLIDTGDIIIDNDGGPGLFGISWRMFTGIGGVSSTTPARNLILNMLDDTNNNIEMDLFNPVIASITMNLGDGDRNIDFTGSSNNPLRDIEINADLGTQNVELAVNAPLAVATLDIDLGAGFDTVDENGNFVTVTENLFFTGVNFFENNGSMIVGGSATIDNSGEAEDSIFDNKKTLAITGNFTYIGGDARDEVRLNGFGGTSIGANAFIDLGGNNGVGTQTALLDSPLTSVGGFLTVRSTGASGPDVFTADAGTTFGKDININLGDGENTATIVGIFNGSFVNYTGGSGVDDVTFGTTGSPAVGWILTIQTGADDDTLTLLGGSSIDNATINMGLGFDTVDEGGNDIDITEHLNFFGVNAFENNGTMTVGGNVIVDSSFETETSVFDDDTTMTIAGNFTYLGGDGRDEVTLNGVVGGTSIGGNALIDLGDNTVGGTQFVFFNVPASAVGGTLTVNSTSAINPDNFQGNAGATFGGDININLGDGPNTANIVGVFGGSSVNYTGGSGVDDVTFGTTGSPADVVVNLGAGDDTFTLLAGSSISPTTLFVDFGSGMDTFINLYGPFDFAAQLLNLNGFSHVYDFPTDTLTSTQVSASGPVTVDNNGPSDSIRFIDGGTSIITPVTNLAINMLGGSGTDLSVALDNPFAGDLTVNLGDGTRALNLTGTDNSVGGNLSVTGGSDGQTVEVAVNNGLTVGGNASFNLGSGNDVVDEDGNDISIIGNLDFVGVNDFSNDGTMTVGGNVSVNNSGETEDSVFDDDTTMTIAGNFTYSGGDGGDDVTLNGIVGGTSIGGDVLIDLGDNTVGGTQRVLMNVPTTSVGGTLTVTSTSAINPDSFVANSGATFGGDINIDLGDGTNTANIVGVFGGSSVNYTGGSGVDNVTFGTTGNPADVNIKLGGGDDTFTLLPGADVGPMLRVDFGGGNDDFVNNFGAFTFNANLLNWHGYNRFYDHAASSLNMVQVLDTGDVTIDNNGVGGAIRLLNGFVTEMTPADDVRLNLIANTSTDVSVDYDLPQSGDTILFLRSGDRDIMFTGDSNQIGGMLRIEGGTNGIQNVELAVNADLDVSDTLVINLRNDHDAVVDGANDVFVGSHMILRAVNTLDINNTLVVGGNLTMNTRFDNESSVFNNGGTVIGGGRFYYLGGNGADNVFANGASFVENVHVDLGNGTNSQTADFSAASVGRLQIVGGSTIGGIHVLTDAATTVTGDVIIGVKANVNNVTLLGNYGGTFGAYRGGAGVDNVVFGATATNMHFTARLAGADDTYTLRATSDLLSTLIDFGPGLDTFIDEFGGIYPFTVSILNLP